jgi:hypothetical protein
VDKKEKPANWAGFGGKPGFGPWPILAIGKFFLFYKLFLKENYFEFKSNLNFE